MAVERQAISVDRARSESSEAGSTGLWWGLFLTAAGVLWLADMTKVIHLPPAIVGAVFAVAGVGFALEMSRDPSRWWAAIPAGALLGLGGLIAIVDQAGLRGEWGAATLLAATGAGFVFAYRRDRRQVWAVGAGGLAFFAAAIVGLVAFSKGVASAAGAATLTQVGGLAALEPYNWMVPSAVLVIGLVLIARSLLDRGAGRRDH